MFASSIGLKGSSNFLAKSCGRSEPYMLSPSMIANSNGKTLCDFQACAATSYCARSPVPVSPRTRNFTEFLPTGGRVSSAGVTVTGAGGRGCA